MSNVHGESDICPAELWPSFYCHFSPTPGQWLSEDHASFTAASQNLYPYVGSSKNG